MIDPAPQSDVAEIAARLRERFRPGPGFTSGVYGILLHDSLPDVFDKDCWGDWFFKPAPSAFDLAEEWGLIERRWGAGRWSFTPLGLALKSHLQQEATNAR